MSRLKDYAKDFTLAKSESCRTGIYISNLSALLEAWKSDFETTPDWHLHNHESYSPELLLSLFTSPSNQTIKDRLSVNLDTCLECVRVFYDAQAVFIERYAETCDAVKCQRDLFAWNCVRLHTTLSRFVSYR
jgi:hypothetical protein